MKVTVGRLAGFCGGVTKSVNTSNKLLDEYGSMYCLGELVHNKQVVDELELKGIKFVEDINDVPEGSRVIIRAHGISKEVYELANKRNLEIFDLTCSNVLSIHELAETLVDDYFIVLVAQRNHPEAIGTISFCGINSIIVEDEEDLEALDKIYKKSGLDKIAVISQTTYSVKKYNDICELIKSKYDNVVIHNTICMATGMRQEETGELSKKVDAMIIIGGSNSSNTKKLYEVSKNNNENTFIIQTVDELKYDDFSDFEHIGIMAGASTPKKSIEEVVEYLERC